MIVDKLENARQYFCLSERIQKGFEFILQNNLLEYEVGKYPIDDENVFLMISQYETKPLADCKIESHLKYIDIQFILKGKEKIGYCFKTCQTPSEAYSSEKDVMFYNEPVKYFTLDEGEFAIFYPSDVHQPGIIAENKTLVRKVVLKIAVQ